MRNVWQHRYSNLPNSDLGVSSAPPAPSQTHFTMSELTMHAFPSYYLIKARTPDKNTLSAGPSQEPSSHNLPIH